MEYARGLIGIHFPYLWHLFCYSWCIYPYSSGILRTGTIVWLFHCQWNNCERYRWTRPVSNHDKLRGKREVPKQPINNTPALVQKMAWCRPGDKPLSEPMSLCFTDAYIRHSASNHNKPQESENRVCVSLDALCSIGIASSSVEIIPPCPQQRAKNSCFAFIYNYLLYEPIKDRPRTR